MTAPTGPALPVMSHSYEWDITLCTRFPLKCARRLQRAIDNKSAPPNGRVRARGHASGDLTSELAGASGVEAGAAAPVAGGGAAAAAPCPTIAFWQSAPSNPASTA